MPRTSSAIVRAVFSSLMRVGFFSAVPNHTPVYSPGRASSEFLRAATSSRMRAAIWTGLIGLAALSA